METTPTTGMEQDLRSGLEIAVIGMAARFPGAKNIEQFWENLKNGGESIAFFSAEDLKSAGIPPETIQAANYVRAKGALEGVEYFDASFFGIKPQEAERMDPQTRILYQCTWEALESAGYNPWRYGGAIGLYAGTSSNFFWETLNSFVEEGGMTAKFAAVQMIRQNHLATGIAYKLNLKGPAITLHTACSTSLVATHLACQALLSGECDIALAGGGSVTLPPRSGYLYQEGLIDSPDGFCRAFDRDAAGTVFGNGAGMVVLKALEDAAADGDTIRAVIRGSAVNNDGSRKVGYTAPSTNGQAEVIRAVYQAADIDPETIGYIEAHGTGTALGDPIEIEALKLAFNTPKKQFCRIGSVKPNIGHLDAAAGVAGFIKTVLILEHRLIPPSLHVKVPNPKIGFENTPFVVNTRLSRWESDGTPLRAGVSAFGVGGTNAHLVLEEAARSAADNVGCHRPCHLMVWSARSQSALDQATDNLAAHLKKHPHINPADAAYTLQVGREPFYHRRMLVCSDIDDALAALSRPESGRVETCHTTGGSPPVIFMFSGQGSQYVNMGRELYETESLFRHEMDRCFEKLKTLLGCNIKEILYPAEEAAVPAGAQEETGAEQIKRTEIAQLVIFALEYALAKLLMSWGIHPRQMIGHSIGEYTAACIAGVLPLEAAIDLVALRGTLMQQMPAGSMLGVKLAEEEVQSLLRGHEQVELAAVNAPALCVVTGPVEAVDTLARELGERGVRFQPLHTSHAFHSQSMEPMLEPFRAKVAALKLSEPAIPYISNVSGKPISFAEVADPGYWANHLRRTVRFSDGLCLLLEEPDALFLEVGAGRSLCSFVQQHSGRKPTHRIVNLIRHPHEAVSDFTYFLHKIGQLWLYGVDIDWKAFHSGGQRRRIPLPTYPFEGQRYWKLMDYLNQNRYRLQSFKPGQARDISDWFYRPYWRQKEFLPAGVKKAEMPGWMVFLDSCGLGHRLIQRLEQAGHRVIVVSAGAAFVRESDRRYTIDPCRLADYRALWREVKNCTSPPHHLLHLWNITGDTAEAPRDSSFFHLLWLIQAMDRESVIHPFRLTVVSDFMQQVTGQESLQPHKALLLGPLKVIPQEYPHLRCRSIDISLPPWGGLEEEQLLGQLVAECSGEAEDTVVAFRNGLRWAQEFEPFKLEQTIVEDSPLKEGGVWLITGGLGNIGLALGRELADSLKAKLVLTGRSPFPPQDQWQPWLDSHGENDKTSRRIRILQALRRRGTEFLVCQADVASLREMQAVVKEAEERFGPLDGVIHGAGVLDGETFSVIPLLTAEAVQRQFLAKVEGVRVLEQVLRGRKLELCLLTSSLSSVLGGLGYAAYAAANIYMDAFVERHNRTDPQQWLSVNLDAWHTGNAGEKGGGTKAMLPQQGVDVCLRAMCWQRSHRLVVSTEDLQARVNQWILLRQTAETVGAKEGGGEGELEERPPAAGRPRPPVSTPYVEPHTPLEQRLAHVWQNFFGFEKVGVHDNFFDLGASSLDLVQLSQKFKKAIGRDIPVVTLFRYPMISALAQYLEGQDHADAPLSQDSEVQRSEDMQRGRQVMQERLALIKEGWQDG
jgi:acyl transferase domain-containing protein